ncbi:MAG TPA: hypothetical protein DCG34_08805 [Clostridiales bacterium]|jgi:hypothetical protein|nr:hypothetical protein [Clostridiales bacterium]
MKIDSKIIAIAMVVMILGGVFTADALGIWKPESQKTPAKFSSGEFAGAYNPEDIRGSYSFGDIENSFDVSVETLADAFGINSTTTDIYRFQLKSLEEIYIDLEDDQEIGTGSVKYFVALYTGVPYTEESDNLPLRAVEILFEEGKIDTEQRDKLMKIVIDTSLYLSPVTENDSNPEPSESTDEHEAEKIINGNTIINDLLNYGITESQLIEVLGEMPASKNMKIRDFCTEKGLSFSEVKNKLTELLN